MSNALLQSIKVTIHGDPLLKKYPATSITSQLHWVVLVSLLNPNCKESLLSMSPQSSSTTLSNSFKSKDAPAIAL